MKKEKNWLKRKREPSVPSGQVRPRVNWGEGRRILAYYMTLMHELIVMESSLIGKKCENKLIVRDFASLMRVIWREDEIINHGYS